MHASLKELLDNVNTGLLWVGRDGSVRHVNAEGAARTGLTAGLRLADTPLAAAVAVTLSTQEPRDVAVPGWVSEGGQATLPEMSCRVIPGLSGDDAFVLIANEPVAGPVAAFDRLMQAVLSDAGGPLGQANDDGKRARQGGASADGLDALCDSVGQVLGAITPLLDLAAARSDSSPWANDRIELWPLLQQVWGEVQPLAQQQQVTVQFRTHGSVEQLATLYGSEAWLRRMFLECLDSALRASLPGTVLDIEHRQMGPRASIVFHDCAMFASPGHPAAERRPATSVRPGPVPPMAARDQIGLTLCRHVLARFGGELREEDEFGVRNVVVELTTGAPHGADLARFDATQAQQYESDLAALVARRLSAISAFAA
jgi:hypothetical protein